MIAPYTLVLHGVMAILCLASLVYLFYKKSDTTSDVLKDYFNWFLFFFLYNISLVLPLLIFNELNDAARFFYAAALEFLGIAAFYAFKVAIKLLIKNQYLNNFLSFIIIAGVTAAAGLHIIFRQIPQILPGGHWIIWYQNMYVSYFYIFFMFVAGWTFALSMLKGYLSLSSTILRVKSLFLCAGSFFLPFAAFFYFGAKNISHIYFAFIFSILGLIFLLTGNLLGLYHSRNTI